MTKLSKYVRSWECLMMRDIYNDSISGYHQTCFPSVYGASEMLVNLFEADILFTALSPVCSRSAHPNWGYGEVNPFGAVT